MRKLHHSTAVVAIHKSVAWRRHLSACVGAHGGHFEHILSRIWFMVQCIKLMPSNFLHLWFLLFDCFVCCQNVTWLKRFTRYGYYTGEMEDNHCQTRNCLWNQSAKNYSVYVRFDDVMLKKVVGFVVFREHTVRYAKAREEMNASTDKLTTVHCIQWLDTSRRGSPEFWTVRYVYSVTKRIGSNKMDRRSSAHADVVHSQSCGTISNLVNPLITTVKPQSNRPSLW